MLTIADTALSRTRPEYAPNTPHIRPEYASFTPHSPGWVIGRSRNTAKRAGSVGCNHSVVTVFRHVPLVGTHSSGAGVTSGHVSGVS